MNPPITYVPDFMSRAEADHYLDAFLGLPWVQRDSARMEYFCSDLEKPYTYGRGAGRRTYEPQPWTGALRFARARVERAAGARFEVLFLNRYHNERNALGWHADDSPEMDDARPIAVVSLGAERDIMFRPRPPVEPGCQGAGCADSKCAVCAAVPDETWAAWKTRDRQAMNYLSGRLRLAHGSLLLMAPGMQDAWQHRIPKASFKCADRVSLTFRGYVVAPQDAGGDAGGPFSGPVVE